MTLTVTSLERVSLTSSGSEIAQGSIYPAFSPDGTKIMFNSPSPDLVPNDTNGVNDLFIRDLATGSIQLVTATASGAVPNSFSDRGFFLPDGEHVFFTSRASDLTANDINNDADFFIRDLTTGDVELLSGNPAADRPNFYFLADTTLSSDGTKVAFVSDAGDMVSGDNNASADVFVKDIVSGTLTRISMDATGNEGNQQSMNPAFSPDGTKVAFASYADNLMDNDSNGHIDVFLKDLASGAITRISTNAAGVEGDNDSYEPVFSPDGTKIAFVSAAANLSPDDPDNVPDIMVKDLVTGEVAAVSAGMGHGSLQNRGPVFSPDGERLAFVHQFQDGPGGPVLEDIFVKDLVTGVLSRVSTNPAGTQGNRFSDDMSFSPDGSRLIFTSTSSNLVADDTNGQPDIFIVRLQEDNIINGTGGDDRLLGRDVAETFNARNGNDRVEAGGGDDVINGGKGDDALFGELGNDILYGNSGNDRLFGGNDDDQLFGQDGNDSLFGEQGDDDLFGGKGDDSLFGNQGNDTLHGNNGNDTIVGGDGDDSVLGDGGNDHIEGGSGKDNLHSGIGDDFLHGGGSSDRLYGDAGNDELHGGSGTNWLTGGADADRFFIDIGNFDGTPDKVTDFDLTEGDTLHVSPVLEGFDPLTSAIADFIKGTETGSNTVVSVDRDGAGATFGFEDVMALRGTTGLDIQDMYANGQLVVS